MLRHFTRLTSLTRAHMVPKLNGKKVLGPSSSPFKVSMLVPLHPHVTTILAHRHLATFNKSRSLAARAAEFPDAFRQWHPTKNIVRPEDVAACSNKRFWFLCDEGHEWETMLASRTQKGGGCPTCNNKRVTSTNNLLVKNPAVAAEWHPTKNGDLKPDAVSYGSRAKVWWQCKEGHEWEARCSNRVTGRRGCPKCAIERWRGVRKGTQSLLAAHPDLAQQWHPTKNGALTPDAVSRASRKKVWWQCPKDTAHEWETDVFYRSVSGSGCPFCSNSAHPLSETNNLLALYPEVAQEWHPTLNGKLTPDKVAGKSNKKVWWACKKCGHEWHTRVSTRTGQMTGCPICTRKTDTK
eukprot:Colp12_sorted_trinity150504_noHs@31701